jgi:hypothetical protein
MIMNLVRGAGQASPETVEHLAALALKLAQGGHGSVLPRFPLAQHEAMLAQVERHAFRVQPRGRPALDLDQAFLAVNRPAALHTRPGFGRRPTLEGVVGQVGEGVVGQVGEGVVGRESFSRVVDKGVGRRDVFERFGFLISPRRGFKV